MTSTAVEVPGSADEHLACPLCDYDLRGLTEARCPECGYAFDWAELRDPTRRLHPYLFEHHPQRNVRSFLRTLLGSQFPRRFWRTLFPTQPSRPRRLLLYAALVASIVLAPFLLLTGYRMYEMDQRARANRVTLMKTMTPEFRAMADANYGGVGGWMDVNMPLFPSRNYFRFRNIVNWWQIGGAFQVTAFAVLWPWLTVLSLLVFRASMRRARVRPVHVLRCVIYTADAAVLIAVAAGAFWFFYDPWLSRSGTWYGTWYQFKSDRSVVYVLGGMFLILTYRLWIAYKRYLRFDHALATAIASQVMIGLLTLKLVADFYSSTRFGGW
jgi:hypothetical protein